MTGVHPIVARNREITRLEREVSRLRDLLERSRQYVAVHSDVSNSAKRLHAAIESALRPK